MPIEQVTCRLLACQKPYKTEIRNGLKQHALCPACREVKLEGKRQGRIRKAILRRRKVSGGIRAKQRGVRLRRKSVSRLGIDHLKADREATLAANYSNQESYTHLSGRVILKVSDMTKMRGRVWLRDRGICQICFKPVNPNLWDLEHKESKGANGYKRDDREQNLQVTHAMRDAAHPCHRQKHNREPKWSKKEQP